MQDAYIEAVQNNDEMQVRRTKRQLERARLTIGVQELKVESSEPLTEGNRLRVWCACSKIARKIERSVLR